MERPYSEINFPPTDKEKVAGSLEAIKQLGEDLAKITALRVQAEADNNLALVLELADKEAGLVLAITQHKNAIEKTKGI